MCGYDPGAPPAVVVVEVDGGVPSPNQKQNGDIEKEAIDGGGLFDPQPPVGILKGSGDYVSAEEEQAAQIPADANSKHGGKRKGKNPRRKLVPVWRLVSFVYLGRLCRCLQ